MADVRQVTAVGRETLESSGDVQEVYDEIVAQANITRIVGLLLGYLQGLVNKGILNQGLVSTGVAKKDVFNQGLRIPRSRYASESGWASATVAIEVSAQHPEEAGGYNIDEPLVVELKDMFGSLVSSDNSTQVSLATGCSKRGMSKDIVSTGSAIFDLLAFGGLPGSECEVVFTAMVSDVELSVTTIVPLRLCHVGEHYDDSASQCVPCSPGSLSFSNDTTPCYDCIGDSGIECKGYADYHIRNGYWLAPAASACDTAACLVSRLYSCEIQDACSTDGSQRNGTGAEVAEGLQLCATAEGFTRAVLCGGTSTPVCASGYYGSPAGDSCLECGNPVVGTLQTILVACALVAVFNSALIFILQR
eukprot:gene6589-7889_t